MNFDKIDTIDNVEYFNFIFKGRIWFGVPIFVFIINWLNNNPLKNDVSESFDIFISEWNVKFKNKGFDFKNDNRRRNIFNLWITINYFFLIKENIIKV